MTSANDVNRDPTLAPGTPSRLPLEDAGISRRKNDTAPSLPTTLLGKLFGLLRRLIPFVLIFAAGGIVGLYFQPPGLQEFFRQTGLTPGGGTKTPIAVAIEKVETKETVSIVSEGDIVALGRIIPQGDVITVSPPFGAGDARISEISVSAGELVRAGDTLAIMDSLGQLESALNTAKANVAVKEAALLQTREAIRVNRAEAEASLARSQATDAASQADLKRKTELMDRGVITRASLDASIARAIETASDVERARATLSRFVTDNGQSQADIAVAEADLMAASAALGQAERDIEKAFVRAPTGGTVLDIHVRPGERPEAQGVLDLGDISQMTVEAEVYQTLIGRVAIGDPAVVTADALDEELQGQVTAIGLAIGRQSITSDDPAANTDARVVDVVITLDERSSKIAERFTNLQTIARIDAGRKP